MIWVLLAFFVTGSAFLSETVLAQPASCSDENSCDTGFYCDRESFHCRKCLSCEVLKREQPLSASPCIKSVAACGPCIKGLVEDHGGDVNSMCVPPDTRTDDDGVPAYVWVAVVVGLILLAVLVLVIVYLLRNTYTFKILAFDKRADEPRDATRTSVQSPISIGNASAPELPPPYDATSSAPYNPQFNAPPQPRDAETPVREDDSSWPFIKRVPSERGEGAGAGAGEREAAGHQAAHVYNYPRYVRAPHLPSYISPSMSDESESTFTVHDEDTMESTWTPAPSADHTDTNGNAVASGPLATLAPAAAHAPSATHAPHTPHDTHAPHALCSRQDTNNNRNPTESNTGAAAAGASAAPSFITIMVQNINSVQQHNDVTL